MKSNHPAWARTTNPDLAAALSVLGIDIEIDKTVESRSGQGWVTILLGLESVPEKEIGLRRISRVSAATQEDLGEDENEAAPLPHYKTSTVLKMLRSGQYLAGDPHHPTLDVLRACKAADILEDACKLGTRYRLVRGKGTERMHLALGEEPQAIKNAPQYWLTRNLKLAACLSVLGCPIARIEGSAGSHAFVFSQLAYQLAPGQPPIVPSEMAQAWRSGRLQELSPEHPLLWMMQGLTNRDGIRDFINHQTRMVLVRAPGTGRASLVPESAFASGRQMDGVKRHLRISF